MRVRDWIYGSAQRGATAIEYGLIAALIAVVIITGLTALGSSLDNKFSSVADTVQSTGGGAASDGDETPTEAPAPTASASATITATSSLTSEPPTDTPAAEPVIVRTDALCWKGPGGDYDIVSSLSVGMEVTLLGRGIVPGWWVIDNPKFPGVPCWTPQEALEVGTNVNVPEMLFSVPPLPTDPPEPAGGNGDGGEERIEGCWVSEGGNTWCQVPCKDPQKYTEVCYE